MKPRTPDVTNKQIVAGLVLAPDQTGFAVDWNSLPSSEHFFVCTDYRIKRDMLNLVMVFGWRSAFEENVKFFNQAIEIRFSLDEARVYLFENVWELLSADGMHPFIDTVKTRTAPYREEIESYRCDLGLPENRAASFRMFAANFVSLGIANGQGLIEFFEVAPDVLATVVRGRRPRPQAGVKSVISIIIDPVRMHSFLSDAKTILEPLQKKQPKLGV